MAGSEGYDPVSLAGKKKRSSRCADPFGHALGVMRGTSGGENERPCTRSGHRERERYLGLTV